MLPGLTATQSFTNLKQWIDTIAMQICPESIALDNEGQRLEGIFQKIKSHEADQLLGQLLSKLKEWGQVCKRNGTSCRKLLKTASTARGEFQATRMVVGPFLS